MIDDRQEALFELPPHEVAAARAGDGLERLSGALPRGIRFGTMSWSYPGWRGIVYEGPTSQESLVRHGLTAYAKHPLLRVVEIDRTYYEPLAAEVFAGLARQVPEDFRFIVKAHERCSVARFPKHARYGRERGESNARYLDVSHATDQVVGPTADGLGAKLGIVLFQFPPQDAAQPGVFVEELHRFLRGLPKTVRYAVELRNTELMTPDYGAALADVGAVHCHNAWTAMPDVLAQARAIPPRARSPLLVRWLVRPGDAYEDAGKRFEPFHRLAAEDVASRRVIARLVAKADLNGVPCSVLVSNNAEGCAPESIARLAREILDRREAELHPTGDVQAIRR